jgi:hypothetical protein
MFGGGVCVCVCVCATAGLVGAGSERASVVGIFLLCVCSNIVCVCMSGTTQHEINYVAQGRDR